MQVSGRVVRSIPSSADPRNGIALHALYDRAFDRGYLTFDDESRVVLSPLLRVDRPSDLHAATLDYMQLTMTCVRCHDYMGQAGLVQLDLRGPTAASLK